MRIKKARALEIARLEEELRAQRRKARREKTIKLRTIDRMREELRGLRESAHMAARELGIPSDAVRGYLYPDGVAIVRVKIPVPRGRSFRDFMLDLHETFRSFPAGGFFEGNLMFTKIPANSDPKAYLRFKGGTRIQMWSNHKLPMMLFGMTEIQTKLARRGFGLPSHVVLRFGRSHDGSIPFTRKKPPASKRTHK